MNFSDNSITNNGLKEVNFLEKGNFEKVNFSKNKIDTYGSLEIITCKDVKEAVLTDNNASIHLLFFEIDANIGNSHIECLQLSKQNYKRDKKEAVIKEIKIKPFKVLTTLDISYLSL